MLRCEPLASKQCSTLVSICRENLELSYHLSLFWTHLKSRKVIYLKQSRNPDWALSSSVYNTLAELAHIIVQKEEYPFISAVKFTLEASVKCISL